MSTKTANADSIVVEWLMSLGLGKYAQSFIDNGYDELELCKQIDQPDLDAIRVDNALHRKILMDSIMTLRSEGATSVYFTLEELQRKSRLITEKQINAVSNQSRSSNHAHTDNLYVNSTSVENQSQRDRKDLADSNPLTDYKKLLEIVLQKLSEENVEISQPPYVLPAGNLCNPTITGLAMRYSAELNVSLHDVRQIMEEIIRVSLHNQLTQNLEQSIDSLSLSSGDKSASARRESNRTDKRPTIDMMLGNATPPTVPSTTPPPTHHVKSDKSKHRHHHNQTTGLGSHSISYHGMPNSVRHPNQFHRSQSEINGSLFLAAQNQQSQAAFNEYRRSSEAAISINNTRLDHTCGRPMYPYYMTHSISMNRLNYPPSSYVCKRDGYQWDYLGALPCPPGVCREAAAVFNEKRIQTLLMVRNGEICVEEAMERIKFYEEQRDKCCQDKQHKKQKKSASTRIGQFFKLPSFRKKKSKLATSSSANDFTNVSSYRPVASDNELRCTCGLSQCPTPPVCTCDQCRVPLHTPQSVGAQIGHRGGSRGSGKFNSVSALSSRRVIGADIVRTNTQQTEVPNACNEPCCRECKTPLTNPGQRPALPRFYSPQVTRKTYQPLLSTTPHMYNKPVTNRFDVWYQQNLPSDDETRHLIDSNLSDDTSSMNTSLDLIGQFATNRHQLTNQHRADVAETIKQPLHTAVPNVSQNSIQPDVSEEKTTSENLQESKITPQFDIAGTVPSEQAGASNCVDEEVPVSGRKQRRDSGCYLSNENINNNSSNSSTGEKMRNEQRNNSVENYNDRAEITESVDSNLTERVENYVSSQRLDLTQLPFSDQRGSWCVPTSLVRQFSTFLKTDMETAARVLDAVRLKQLELAQRPAIPL